MPLLKGGLVLVDYNTGAVQRVIPLQYNPETLNRTLQVQGVGPDSRATRGPDAAQGAADRDLQARSRTSTRPTSSTAGTR